MDHDVSIPGRLDATRQQGRRWARIAALACLATGLWSLSFRIAGSPQPMVSGTGVATLTAITLVLVAVALWLAAGGPGEPLPLEAPGRWRQRVGLVTSLLVVALPLAGLLDTSGTLRGQVAPVTSINTAIALGLLGIGLLVPHPRLVSITAAVVGLIGVVDLGGHAYAAPSVLQLPPYRGMSIPTALTLIVAAGGVVGARATETRIGSILFADSSAGVVARRLLPLTLLVPLVVSLLIVEGQRDGMIEWQDALAMLASSVMLLAVVSVMWTSGQVLAAEHARDRSEEKLSEHARMLDLASEIGQLGYWCLVPETDTRIWSPRCVELLGLQSDPPPATIDESLAAIHPEDRARALELTRAAVTDHRPLQYEARVLAQDGGVRHVAVTARPRTTADGRPELFGVVLDLTERKQAEQLRLENQRLEQTARHKDQFLSAMSHEFRTPLSGVLSGAEALLDARVGPLTPLQQELAQAIHESGTHLLELVNDILDLRRIEAGRMSIHIETCRLDDVCRSAIRLTRQVASNSGKEIEYSIEDASIQLVTDPRRLKQILVNLLSNAIKFTGAGQRVWVDVRSSREAASPGVSVVVGDEGIGISAEDLQRVFEPFIQADSGSTRKYQGSGLGLSLVKEMTTLLAARLDVESTPGHGSRFTVTLPLGRG